MASFDFVNYLLRPNKNVERKLMVEALGLFDDQFLFSQYRYVGLGSMWFVDFSLLHRTFGISDMVSIEKDSPDRADFNRPFNCVRVEPGESTIVLPNIGLDEKRTLIWMDYDSGLFGPALEDAVIVAEKVLSGSVFAISVNAHHGQLRRLKRPNGDPLSPEEALRDRAGGLVPRVVTPAMLDRLGFPSLVARILIDGVRHALVAAGRAERFIPLFNFSYQDGAPIVTVGGMIASEEDARLLEQTRVRDLDFVANANGEPFPINVPHLTPREKHALDQLLPRANALGEQFVLAELGFSLEQPALDSYSRFYPHYPVFGEFML